jgi:hypothetical protein
VGEDPVASQNPSPARPISEPTVWTLSYRVMPTIFGERRGSLRLDADRLTFVEKRGRVRVDAPLQELHSVHPAEAGAAFDIWHGNRRHRLVGGSQSPVTSTQMELDPGGSLGRSVGGLMLQRAVVARLVEELRPVVGPVPPGVRVRRPAGPGRHVAQIVLGCFASVALLILVTWLVWLVTG